MNDPMSSRLVFVKLGGSLITDKRQQATPRLDVLHRLAGEVRASLDADPGLRLLLGHGSGSFGHWEANAYRTHEGVRTADQWYGFSRVSAAALSLNRLVVESFVEAGVPVLSLQPAASVRARDGQITHLETAPIRSALAAGLVPLVFGDVAFDELRGGAILSTEDLFSYLGATLEPAWILLFGNAPGVLDGDRKVIPLITPVNFNSFEDHVRKSGYTDVTGGMDDKVRQMIDLVTRFRQLKVRIITGLEPDSLRHALLDPDGFAGGTLICASPPER
jgi:isopentenyl phosphate kinase